MQWFFQRENLSPEDATWEDAEVIKHTFPKFFGRRLKHGEHPTQHREGTSLLQGGAMSARGAKGAFLQLGVGNQARTALVIRRTR